MRRVKRSILISYVFAPLVTTGLRCLAGNYVVCRVWWWMGKNNANIVLTRSSYHHTRAGSDQEMVWTRQKKKKIRGLRVRTAGLNAGQEKLGWQMATGANWRYEWLHMVPRGAISPWNCIFLGKPGASETPGWPESLKFGKVVQLGVLDKLISIAWQHCILVMWICERSGWMGRKL